MLKILARLMNLMIDLCSKTQYFKLTYLNMHAIQFSTTLQ